MGGYDSAEASHQALRGIQRELERHPVVDHVEGFPDGAFTRLLAVLTTASLDDAAGEATLTVRWFAGETPDSQPEFSFHYSDDARDFGWHHEPNPHVEGWGHFQKRAADETEYTYEPHEFTAANPTRLVWELMETLSATLSSA